ncbi:MAG: HlyD family secretion protein, partial [Planctomycetes bacterium]|jgi:multidrug resistance efflux pump|nr:HlyD family secretion protein [Planctomycetota bacterium]
VAARNGDRVEPGDLVFRLDNSRERAAVETARRRIAEIEAAVQVAQAELAAADGAIDQAIGSLEQAEDELARQLNLQARNPDVVSGREIDRLQNLVESRQGALEAARANRQAVQTRIDVQLPAQRESAEAQLAEAQVALDKTRVTAGVAGTVQQFQLQVGDFVSPLLRPAGILVPETSEEGAFIAGFGQLSAQVIAPGMLVEVACATNPFQIVPMRVARVQDVIAAGQFRPGDALLDVQERTQGAGTLTVFLEELYPGQGDVIPPGSRCVANAYTTNHDRLQDPDMGAAQRLYLHMVDTVGIAHAALLRIQVFLLPVQTLVFAGGH